MAGGLESSCMLLACLLHKAHEPCEVMHQKEIVVSFLFTMKVIPLLAFVRIDGNKEAWDCRGSGYTFLCVRVLRKELLSSDSSQSSVWMLQEWRVLADHSANILLLDPP